MISFIRDSPVGLAAFTWVVFNTTGCPARARIVAAAYMTCEGDRRERSRVSRVVVSS